MGKVTQYFWKCLSSIYSYFANSVISSNSCRKRGM